MFDTRFWIRGALSTLAVLMASAGTPASAQAPATPPPARVVNVYNWSDYIDVKVLDDFTKETGIRVVYDTYDNNELLEAKLLAGKTGYDIVVPTGPFLQRLIKANVFAPLDRAKLPNLRHLWPEIAQRLAVFDPGNRHAVNYMWGTTGIGYNVKKVRERLGDAPIDSWKTFLDPAQLGKLKDCGVHALDAPEDIFPGVMRYLGLNPDTKALADYDKATAALMRVRGLITKFHSSEYINALANGDICFVVGYSGDVLQARKRAQDAKNGVEIAYIAPKEGALMWFDNLAIPADAANKDEAHALLDFLMRPDIAARNSNVVAYANGNLASQPLIDPAVRNDPGIYPDTAAFARLFTNTTIDDRLQRSVTRLWTRVKTGR